MSTATTATTSGIGLGSLGFLVLFIMKIAGATEMSWLLVLTSMIWLPVLFVLGILGVIGGIAGAIFGFAWIIDKAQGR